MSDLVSLGLDIINISHVLAASLVLLEHLICIKRGGVVQLTHL